MKLVLDASVALSWIFERAELIERQCAVEILKKMLDMDILVPSLWHIEISNALLVAERRKIITEAQIIDYFKKLDSLPFKTESTVLASRRNFVISLAREHALTAYDAVYLDLALENNAMLATFDKKLAQAMSRAGGKLYKHKLV